MFVNEAAGALVEISGTDSRTGDWQHKAFIPSPLPAIMPELTMETVLAVANPTFTVRRVERALDLSYGGANKVVAQLVELGVLAYIDPDAYKRLVYAPRVHDALLGQG